MLGERLFNADVAIAVPVETDICYSMQVFLCPSGNFPTERARHLHIAHCLVGQANKMMQFFEIRM